MNAKYHLVVLDPIAFFGGSKVATDSILQLLDERFKITVLSADHRAWKSANLTRVKLFEPAWLGNKEQGIPYYIHQLYIAFNLLILRCRFGRIDIALGASGPGVDLALYLLKVLLNFRIIQLIHGPVACSRSIKYCLNNADFIYYLNSSKKSICSALSCNKDSTSPLPSNFQLMKNGLSEINWPTATSSEKVTFFWAASLLKWKGLDLFVSALNEVNNVRSIETHICYIRPNKSTQPCSELPTKMANLHCHENPDYLDVLRAQCNVFISTSINEPFGLSILEAMAAGLCVVIPSDGAYWDKTLIDQQNCIKYQANDQQDLSHKLIMLSTDVNKVQKIGMAAKNLAKKYQASKRYANIKIGIESLLPINQEINGGKTQ